MGTSLAVFSGYRFVKRAHERGQPIALINLGETRGDALATLRIEAPIGEVLPALAARVLGHAWQEAADGSACTSHETEFAAK